MGLGACEGGPVITDTPASVAGAPRVLILEDEPLTAMMLARAVTARGLAVSGPYHRPEKALDALRADAPDAALLDVSLGPAATSLAVADALAAGGVPFAFITGYGPETAPVVAAHPDKLVIPKPVDQDTVWMLLGELLGEVPGRAKGAA